VTTVSTLCATCGAISVPIEDVTVRLCQDVGVGEYVLRCPVCEMAGLRTAPDSTMNLLVGAGAEFQVWSLPFEWVVDRLDGLTEVGVETFAGLLGDDESLSAGVESLRGQ